VKYTATITRLSDGKTVTWADELDDAVWGPAETPHGIWFMWTGGNYGCDCNRDLYFGRAEGIDEGVLWERESGCGTTRYTVPYIDLENGTRIAIDTDPVVAKERAAEAAAG
jgi:hypothetical protein